MEQITALIEEIIKRKRIERTKLLETRRDFIGKFVAEINKERENSKYSKVTMGRIAKMLVHLKSNTDLHFFYNQCARYKKDRKGDFSKCFFGSLKAK